MRNGLRLGRIFGIQITIDLSWIVIFLLVCWNLTMAFSMWHRDWPFGQSIALAVVAALLFFGSVLAHELAHSLVARAFDVGVREIRLFLFGGVSNIAEEPPSAKAELLIAIVGPLTSIVFGVVTSVIASLLVPSMPPGVHMMDVVAAMGPAATLLMWLGSINIIVGLFNLIPGFPLDGGRILRAILWASTKDLRRATLWASGVGQFVGWLFVALGVAMFFGISIPFFGRGLVSGLWLVFIGWFLASAARTSYEAIHLRDVLAGVHVVDLMRRSGPVMPVGTTVAEAADRWFMRMPEHAFPVVDEGGLLAGIVCPSDIRKLADDRWQDTKVSEVMTPYDRLALATPMQEAGSALAQLAQRDIEQLPVVRDGTRELVGMLDRRDVARWLELRAGPAPLRHRPA